MRKIALLVLATAGLGLSQAASAADLGTAPLYRKAAPVETYSWTGAYIGGFVGGAFGAGDATTSTPVDNAGTPLFASPAATYDLGSSFIGGMTDGYNWQVAPNWVIGYESETVMDGLDAVREIRAREASQGSARTPIIMLTANARPEHVAASREAGADLHLEKPITSAMLFAAIGQAFEAAQGAPEAAAASA